MPSVVSITDYFLPERHRSSQLRIDCALAPNFGVGCDGDEWHYCPDLRVRLMFERRLVLVFEASFAETCGSFVGYYAA